MEKIYVLYCKHNTITLANSTVNEISKNITISPLQQQNELDCSLQYCKGYEYTGKGHEKRETLASHML